MEAVEEFNPQTKQDLADMFKEKDVDGTGTLSPEELEQCLHLLGLFPTEEELAFFSETFDKNQDGELQISELVDNAHTLVTHSLQSDDMIAAFKCLDTSGDGYIRFTELQKILCHKGFMSGVEVGQLISQLSEFDEDGDGKFSYTEFVKMYLSDKFKESTAAEIVE